MAAPRSGTGEGETMGLPVLGQEGDTCEQCGSTLATDQRYCLNCGWRRGESRVDYERRLNGGVSPNGATAAVPVTSNPQWTPAFAILAIALLGVMLLLGVLIGKKGNGSTQTVAAQAAPTTTTAAAPTTPTTATPTAAASKGGGKGAGASTAPGQGNVVQGGSGSTAGVQAANTNASVQDQAKNGADVQATQGTPAATDNKPAGGGSGGATCIGC